MNKLAAMLAGWLAIALGQSAFAQQAGDATLAIGAVHTQTFGASSFVHTSLRDTLIGRVLGIPSEFDSPGTEAKPGNSNTLLLGGSYYFTNHISVAFDGGLPPRFDINGRGVVAPSGLSGTLFNVDLGAAANNPLASVREWSPALLALYSFGAPTARIRPRLGIGLAYVWYSGLKLDPDFENALKTRFGSVLAVAAGKPGETQVSANASRQFAPVFNAGATLRLSSRWSLSAAASYVPLSTTATIDVNAADGTALAVAKTRIKLRPLLGSLLLNYRFAGP